MNEWPFMKYLPQSMLDDGLSSISALIEACERGDGIDQHCGPDLVIARDEIVRLRANVAQLTQERDTAQARIKALEKAVHDARFQLRSTSDNWHEDCLFMADRILTSALKGTEQQEKSSC